MARIAHLEAEALGAFIQCSWFPVAGRAVKGGMCGGRRGKGEDSPNSLNKCIVFNILLAKSL